MTTLCDKAVVRVDNQQGLKALHNISALPSAKAKLRRAADLLMTSAIGSPVFIESDLQMRLKRDVAFGPNPPVDSTAKGENPHPA